MWGMNKLDAIKQLGGTFSSTARACGITPSAVWQWPDVLNKVQTDRVQAALYRMQKPPGKKAKAKKAEA